MVDSLLIIISIIFLALALGLASAVFSLRRALNSKNAELIREKEESARRLYEVSILKEIGEQTGYSLDVEQILQIIAGSLHQFINYCAVSYIVVLPDKLKLHTRLEQSVSNIFLADLKTKMLASLSTLAGKDFNTAPLAETRSGAIVVEAVVEPIGSFFNIPLTISGSLSGLLTVAHVKPGLYKEADMTILYKIVNQASLAVTRLQAVVKKEEERIGKIREEFTSMIVHELRSPLDGIR
ncbi:MAG: GAF domain-containing protein, partial [Patescibacteria group bacterium]